jgi:MerR family mercuric resistance operon transcriptional regulator
MTIGKLARTAAVNVETVRYYERRGLIARPARAARGFRRYPPETLARLRFIKRAQELGFILREITELLALGSDACAPTRTLAERKRTDIDARLRDLKAMRRTLTQLIRRCDAGRTGSCPIVDSLNGSRQAGPRRTRPPSRSAA